ncbi:MAG: hypothetical protein H6948_17355 [Zoogloeaceae bacterium]|nr:hypothetical protein [Zoogloeaceae bacterium]
MFFYSSPDGGRVFFDELGPPWPKHPCTDSSVTGDGREQSRRSHALVVRKSPTKFGWQQEGWQPFICDSFALVPPGKCGVIGGLFGDAHLSLFVTEKSFLVRAPYQLKRIDADTYVLATVQPLGGTFKVFKVRAYRHLRDAIEATKVRRPPTSSAVSVQPKAGKRALPRAMLSPPNQPAARSAQERSATALELAFKRAQAGRLK